MIKMAYNFNTQMTFQNGLTISMAIGEGNYCTNRNTDMNPYANKLDERESANCEVMVWDLDENDLDMKQFLPSWYPINEGQKVAGWVNTNVLAEIISKVANYKI